MAKGDSDTKEKGSYKVVTYTFGEPDTLNVNGYLLPKNTPVQMPAKDAESVQQVLSSRRVEVSVEDLTKENKPSTNDEYGGNY